MNHLIDLAIFYKCSGAGSAVNILLYFYVKSAIEEKVEQ